VTEAVGLEIKPKLVCVFDGDIESSGIPAELVAAFDIIPTTSPIRTLHQYRNVPLAGIFVASSQLPQAMQLLESDQLLRSMPDGVVVLDGENKIVWANDCFIRTFGVETVAGKRFYEVLRHPEVMGPEFCPFQTARTCGPARRPCTRPTIATSIFTRHACATSTTPRRWSSPCGM
jgi:PAS domain-containing protein